MTSEQPPSEDEPPGQPPPESPSPLTPPQFAPAALPDPPRRQHAAAITITALGAALQLVAGLVIVTVLRGGTPGIAAALAAGGILAGAGIGYAQWRRTTYWLDDVALHHRSGVFTPDQKVVPRARVQSVDTATGPLQRIFGVVELHVQVAGASSADEIVLVAVTQAEADRLRDELGQPRPVAPDERVRLGVGGLLLAALTGPQIGVAVSAVAGVGALVDNAVDVQDGEGLVSRLDSPNTILLVAAVVIGGAYVLSFLAAIVVFAGFEVQREGDVLRIRRGLLARRASSLPLSRVDGVVIVEGLARGPLGFAALRLESAALGGERAVARTLLPLVRRRDAEAIVARLVPDLRLVSGELQRPPRRALRRFMLVPALAGALAGGLLALAVGPSTWPAAPALALAGALVGIRRHRATGVRMAGDVVVVREARLARRTLLARRHRLQEHAVAQTPLQARATLTDLSVTVGSGGRGRARHLESSVAEETFAALRSTTGVDAAARSAPPQTA